MLVRGNMEMIAAAVEDITPSTSGPLLKVLKYFV
jgi:hypothetical protein